MHKLERLLNLTAALLNATRPLTAEQIHQQIEGYPAANSAFHRAFERDKDELRAMGIPIVVEPVPGTDPPLSGYRIHRRDYAGQNPNLAADELAALAVASNLVRLQGVEATGAFWKIGGLPDAPPTEAPLAALPAEANLGPLFRAASELRLAQFRYHGVTREVEPRRLSFTRGHWYLSAFDRTRDAERLYRVDRIDGEVALGERGAFARGPASDDAPLLRAWELGDGDAVTALVCVDPEQSDWALAHLGTDALVERRADGSVVLRFAVRNTDAFRGFVLTFLEHAEVLAPTELRDDLVGWLEAQLR